MIETIEKPKEIASESGHWYRPDGTPAYTVIGKNGKERATTLRDARVEGLVPSVTTILQVLPKPFLQKWLQKQVLMSALTLPRIQQETDEEYISRILTDADEQSRKARERGSEIHGAIEKWLLRGEWVEPDLIPYVGGAIKALTGHLGQGCIESAEPEKSFASTYGYGGKVDLHSKELNFVCDFKTKEFSENDTIITYDEHLCQLAAYAEGLNMPEGTRLLNVFISTTVPGLARVVEHTGDAQQAFQVFYDCLTLWRRIRKF